MSPAPITYAPQWLRCDANGELCVQIAGATGWSYELVQAEVGHTIRLEVAATNAQGTVRARSFPTQLLPPDPPRNVVSPRVTGTAARVGALLTGHAGTWVGTGPIEYAPQWLRCDLKGDACVAIAGATGWIYVPAAADQFRGLRLEVTATNVDGTATARSFFIRIT